MLTAAIALIIASNISYAQEAKDVSVPERQSLLTPVESVDSSLETHGFMSQGYVQSTNNNFFPDSVQGTTQFAEIGFNINKQLTPDLRAGFQLFARDYGQGSNPSFQASFDWFLLDYHWRDWLGIRAGRIKLPFGLYNDTSDIDLARDPILLPQSVYPYSNTNFLLAQTGIELYGIADMSSVGALEYRLYHGTIEVNTAYAPGSPFQILDLYVPYVSGGRVIWDTPLDGLRIGVSSQDLLLSTDLVSGSTRFSVSIPATLTIGSLEYTYKSFQLVAEYSKWWVSSISSNTSLFPNSAQTSEKYYVMASYRVRNWLRPGLYYSASFPDATNENQSQNISRDYAAFLRIDLYSNWIFKLEAHYMDGTAGLSSSLNGGTALSAMPEYWALFLARTTVSF